MRVLLATGALRPMTCGVGDYTEALAEALGDLPGTEVGVLTSLGARGGPARRFPVFPVMERWNRPEFGRAEAVVQEFRPDLIHVQYPSQAFQDSAVHDLPRRLRRLGVPVVETWHEYVPMDTPLKRRTVRVAVQPGGIIVVRRHYRARMPWWHRLLMVHRRLELIPNAATVPRVVLSEAERAAEKGRWAPGKALVVFFGFLFEHKGIEELLRILDPARHQLVLAGDPKPSDPYQVELLRRVREPPLSGYVTAAGFQPAEAAARLLAAADAVALPFRAGGGDWNTSLKAAMLQGTFVLTTSFERHGYDAEEHAYYARPGDLADLRQGLLAHLGTRNPGDPTRLVPSWAEIARRHLAFYARCR